MSMSIDPESIVWNTFGGLEPPVADWATQVDYWEDYTKRFFQSNGLTYVQEDSNVIRWLSADDRAPFAEMARAMLPKLGTRADLSDVDLVILAHWLPDIHLGTSVTNFVLQSLGQTDGLGFAISDHGRSAPLFALHCIDRYLASGHHKALLVVADQKHLLYQSPIVTALDPHNAASMILTSHNDEGPLRYLGYRRRPNCPHAALAGEMTTIASALGMDPHACTLIAEPGLLAAAAWPGRFLPQNPRLLCSAPFAVLADHGETGCDHLLVVYEEDCLTAVGFSGSKRSAS